MKDKLNAIGDRFFRFEYESGPGSTFVCRIDPMQGQRLIPYQLRMLQTAKPARFLPVQLEEMDGNSQLRYDYTGLRRFTQLLRTDPPDFDQFLELANVLVRTIADCAGWMLEERGFVLHEELIFAGSRLTDLKLCYVPVEGRPEEPVADLIRLLLLKMLGTVQTPIDRRFVPIFDLLSRETYSIHSLAAQLKRIWLEQPARREERSGETGEASPLLRYWRFAAGLVKRQSLFRRATDSRQRPHKDKTAPSHTQLLSAVGTSGEMVIAIYRHGKEERFNMIDERFVIGRSESGVHYSDDSAGVSRIHCEIVRDEAGLSVTDLGSLNGTRLNGERLVPYKPQSFKIGDVLAYAHTEIRLLAATLLSQPG